MAQPAITSHSAPLQLVTAPEASEEFSDDYFAWIGTPVALSATEKEVLASAQARAGSLIERGWAGSNTPKVFHGSGANAGVTNCDYFPLIRPSDELFFKPEDQHSAPMEPGMLIFAIAKVYGNDERALLLMVAEDGEGNLVAMSPGVSGKTFPLADITPIARLVSLVVRYPNSVFYQYRRAGLVFPSLGCKVIKGGSSQ